MSLRKKTLIVIGSTLALMIVIIYSITSVILLGGYSDLETQVILNQADQSVKLIGDELNQLKSVTGDWAPWDETYRFIQDLNQEYIDNNLMDNTFVNLHINFLVFMNIKGSVTYCKFFDLETSKKSKCSSSILSYIESNYILLQNNQNPLSGITVLPGNPLLISAAPILTSQFNGPVQGTLIAGRYLNHTEIKRLAAKSNLSMELHLIHEEKLPRGFKLAKQSLSPEKQVVTIELDPHTIAAYSLLTDLNKKPILLLGVDKEREIYAQGKTSMTYLLTSLLVTGLVFIVATLLFIEGTVLSRMIHLIKDVKHIGLSGNLFQKTKLSGNDELADLSDEINQMIESVRINKERDRAILKSIADGYFELDLKGNLTFFNDSLIRMFRSKREDLQGVHYREILDKSTTEKVHERFQILIQTGIPIQGLETELTLENNDRIFLETTASLIKNSMGHAIGFRGITRDVSDRKKTSDKLHFMAYHDSLTGLMNRKAFHEHMEKELIYAERYSQQRSLLYIDLDKFKKVNDTYGHQIGDQLLQEFSSRIEATLRNTDMIYRLGGDEFAIILSDPSDQDPETVAQRIIGLMENPFQIEKAHIDFVTASIGISIFPVHGTDKDSLIFSADKAMYKAKQKQSTFST